MNNHSIKSFVGLIVALGLEIVLLAGSFLPGKSNIQPKNKQPKMLTDFLFSCPSAIFKHRSTFTEARRAQMNNDFSTATRLYNELLKVYPNNEVVQHNLSMMNNFYG